MPSSEPPDSSPFATSRCHFVATAPDKYGGDCHLAGKMNVLFRSGRWVAEGPVSRMKIVVVHNFYQQPGGEDQVFADESALLESRGHAVVRHTVDNDALDGLSALTIAGKTLWNRDAAAEVDAVVRRERADVVHFHNTFPLLSPAVYGAARGANGGPGAAVVQTLHNYRLICPNAVFFRDNQPCEDCLGKTVPWPAVTRGCYRGSRTASAGVAAMLTAHRLRGTYRNDVDAYIVLTPFARDKFVEAGFDDRQLFLKPNFVPSTAAVGDGSGHFFLFVGRLSAGKGLPTLLAAWRKLQPNLQLRIVGDGEGADDVRAAAAADPRIQWLGPQPIETVYRLMGEATALVFPSVWYEAQPKTVIEAMAVGTPVIASGRGAAAGMVRHGVTGVHFETGNATALAAAVEAVADGPSSDMRTAARAEYLRQYTPDQNYARLMEIYAAARERRFPTQPVAA